MTNTTFPAPTASGPVCARCSHWADGRRVQVRHESVEAVRFCSISGPIPVVDVPVVERVAEFVPATDEELIAAFARAAAPAPVVERPEVVEGGAWVLGSRLLRVKKGRSGRLYCVEVVDGFDGLREDEQPVWGYAAGAISELRRGAGRPMTTDEVARFGHCCGYCVFCNRKLDDTRSVNAGYGPVCAGKFDLPWG